MNDNFRYPLRIVVLDNPLANWNDLEVQAMFCKMAQMKINGYFKLHHTVRMVPVDSTDIIGTNFVICYDTPQGLLPLMGYRGVELARCEFHRIEFPISTIVRASKLDPTYTETELARIRAEGRRVTFKSSWSKTDLIPQTKEASLVLRDLVTTIAVNYMREAELEEWFTCGAVKFKTDQYFDYLGLKRITEAFPQYSFFDNEAVMFHMSNTNQFSAPALSVAAKNSQYWENKIVIGSELASVKKKAA